MDDFEKSLKGFKETLNEKYDDSVLTLQLTKEEVMGLMNCIVMTYPRRKDLDVGLKIVEQLEEFIIDKE
jgi:hypothetical protein